MILRPGEQPVPGYRLQQRLGRGAIGEVWKASAPGGTSVALKFVNLAGKPAIKELRALQHVKQVRHANLTPIHAFWMLDQSGEVLSNEAIENYYGGKTAGRPEGGRDVARPTTLIIAMQIGDESLADRLERFRREGKTSIPVDELLDYMRDAAKGLDFLNAPRHDLGSGPVGIQHCDVKPQNILLMGDSASVCDFGLARVLGESHTTSAMAGSPAYMAPECIEGHQPSDATDQYSLAISYAELRTGYLPFRDLNYGDVLHAHLTGGLKLDALPPAEQEVIRRATSRVPASRYPSCVAMVKALRRAVEGLLMISTDGSFASSGFSSSGFSSSNISGGISTTNGSLDVAPLSVPPRSAEAPASPSTPAREMPSAAATADEIKLQVMQLTREANFNAALDAIDRAAGLLSEVEMNQLRTAVARRWFAHVVQPIVDRNDFLAATTAIESGAARYSPELKQQWLAEIKSRWTRYAAGQLKKGRNT